MYALTRAQNDEWNEGKDRENPRIDHVFLASKADYAERILGKPTPSHLSYCI